MGKTVPLPRSRPEADIPRLKQVNSKGQGPDVSIRIGPNLKRLRGEKGWSLDTLAQKAGVSRAMVSQIERGRSAPTINVVWKLARAFDVQFSVLMANSDTDSIRCVPVNASQVMVSSSGRLTSRALFPADAAPRAEFYEMRLRPGSVEEAAPHPEGALENLVVSSGCLEIQVAGETFSLVAGDAALFAGDQRHVYRNTGDQEAVVYLVMTYP